MLDQTLTFAGALGNQKLIEADNIKDLLGLVDTAKIAQFVDFILEKDRQKAINFLQEIFNKGYDPQEFAKALVHYLRQSLLLKIGPSLMNPVIVGLTKEEQIRMQNQIKELSSSEIQRALNIFLEAENKMKYSPIPELPLELAIIDIISEES